MIIMINTTIVTILTIAIITIVAINYGKKSVMFVVKKIVTLMSIQKISNKKQKIFEDKTGNFVERKRNTMHF